ncbi:MAG TPA: dTDP-glucose 4,6-dehydratase [Candidatus Obscuribacterales bacterium]
MRLLVTGGLGFIGSNFVRLILRAHPTYSVVNVDAVTYAGHPENLQDVESDPRYTFVKGRVEDRDLIHSILLEERYGAIDGIVNIAAETHVDRSIVDPSIFVLTNVVGTQVLLDAAYLLHKRISLSQSGRQVKFVQVSTDEVYGSLDADGYFTENTPLAPNSPYSASKASGDFLCRAYHHTYGLPVSITRCSNNYGPYQHPEKLIPLFIANALENKSVPVYGDGLNVRDWLHVEDHCDAIDLVLHKGKPGEVYNVGGNNEWPNINIAKLILKELGKGEELIQYVEDRPGHDRRYAIDASKIKKELGWAPKHTFDQGIKETIRWYKENRQWLDAVTRQSAACRQAT